MISSFPGNFMILYIQRQFKIFFSPIKSRLWTEKLYYNSKINIECLFPIKILVAGFVPHNF